MRVQQVVHVEQGQRLGLAFIGRLLPRRGRPRVWGECLFEVRGDVARRGRAHPDGQRDDRRGRVARTDQPDRPGIQIEVLVSEGHHRRHRHRRDPERRHRIDHPEPRRGQPVHIVAAPCVCVHEDAPKQAGPDPPVFRIHHHDTTGPDRDEVDVGGRGRRPASILQQRPAQRGQRLKCRRHNPFSGRTG